VRARRCGAQEVGVGNGDRGDIADERGAAPLMQVADVVGGMARRVGDSHAEHLLAARERLHVGLRHRDDLAPEPLHRISVEALGAGQKP
jgi:hypothetical protein